MATDPNKKTLRHFQCRDYLWETFEQLSAELECSVDYLINEAMRQYARSRQQGGRVSAPPAPPAQRESAPPLPPTQQQPALRTPIAPPSVGGRTPAIPSMPGTGGAGPKIPALPGGARPPMGTPATPGSRPGMPAIPPLRSPGAPAGAPPIPRAGGSMAPPPMAGNTPRVPPMPSSPAMPAVSPMPPVAPRAAPPPAAPPPAAAPTLYAIYEGQQYPVTKDEFIIGRGQKTSDLCIRDSNVSRRHAVVVLHNGQFWMVDQQSTNGVEFLGAKIDRTRIDDGDVFKICDYEVTFVYR
jgi:hypothetical protein